MRDLGIMQKHKENKAFLICPSGISKHHGFPLFLRKVNSEPSLLAKISVERLTWNNECLQ